MYCEHEKFTKSHRGLNIFKEKKSKILVNKKRSKNVKKYISAVITRYFIYVLVKLSLF